MLLANVLKDAGVNAIFTSSLQRAVKTAVPLAIASRIEPKPLPQLSTKFDPKDMQAFVELLRSQHRDSIVLFVGQSNTVPALIKALGHTDGDKDLRNRVRQLVCVVSEERRCSDAFTSSV